MPYFVPWWGNSHEGSIYKPYLRSTSGRTWKDAMFQRAPDHYTGVLSLHCGFPCPSGGAVSATGLLTATSAHGERGHSRCFTYMYMLQVAENAQPNTLHQSIRIGFPELVTIVLRVLGPKNQSPPIQPCLIQIWLVS